MILLLNYNKFNLAHYKKCTFSVTVGHFNDAAVVAVQFVDRLNVVARSV